MFLGKELLSISEVAQLLGVSMDTLRRWDKSGKLPSFRPYPQSHRYYRSQDIVSFLPQNLLLQAKNWVIASHPSKPDNTWYCETRDTFQARLSHMQSELVKLSSFENISYLCVAIAGEIGNNSFDHNLGNWPDIAGIFFGYDLKKHHIILADRGQGIFKTLKRVKPKMKDDQEALKVAFTEILSGRAPEARGNGLKFVKYIVMNHPLKLQFQSGNAELQCDRHHPDLLIQKTREIIHGCLAIIEF